MQIDFAVPVADSLVGAFGHVSEGDVLFQRGLHAEALACFETCIQTAGAFEGAHSCESCFSHNKDVLFSRARSINWLPSVNASSMTLYRITRLICLQSLSHFGNVLRCDGTGRDQSVQCILCPLDLTPLKGGGVDTTSISRLSWYDVLRPIIVSAADHRPTHDEALKSWTVVRMVLQART